MQDSGPIFRPALDAGTRQSWVEWQQASNTFGLTSKVAWTTNVASGPWSTNGLQVTNLGPAPAAGYRRYEARFPVTNGSNVLLRVAVE